MSHRNDIHRDLLMHRNFLSRNYLYFVLILSSNLLRSIISYSAMFPCEGRAHYCVFVHFCLFVIVEFINFCLWYSNLSSSFILTMSKIYKPKSAKSGKLRTKVIFHILEKAALSFEMKVRRELALSKFFLVRLDLRLQGRSTYSVKALE